MARLWTRAAQYQHVTARLRQAPAFWPCLLAAAAVDAAQPVADAFPSAVFAPAHGDVDDGADERDAVCRARRSFVDG